MEKIILTKKQANVIENFKDGFDNIMNGLTYDDFIKAVKDGYEVEPEFKVGDWVVHKNGNPFNTYLKPLAVKITSVKKDNVYYAEDCNVTYSERIRHATPSEIAKEKERRFFAKHGRESWELRHNDILFDESEEWAEVVDSVEERDGIMAVVFRSGDYSYLCDVKKYSKVAVFAKDRLDVKTND